MKHTGIILFSLTFLAAHHTNLSAQDIQHSPWKYLGKSTGIMDSDYITNYDRLIVGRIYYSRTNTGTEFRAQDTKSFNYKPNNSKGLGFGISYRYLTLNLAFGVLGRDEDKGKTHSLNLQSSLYKHEWVYDFGIQHYRGMYFTPQNVYSTNNNYYLRPDVSQTVIGGDFWRILNSDKFSYRAVMTQNDWQLKPAGSLLLGGEIYYGGIRGDSALVPNAIAANYPQNQVTKDYSLRIGPGVGYAYTYVYKKNWFASAGITENLDFTMGKEYAPSGDKNVTSFSPNLNYKVSIGYNSKLWNINASILNNSQYLKSYYAHNYKLFSQVFRITIARRFIPNHKVRKLFLNKVDTQMDNAEQKANHIVNQTIGSGSDSTNVQH